MLIRRSIAQLIELAEIAGDQETIAAGPKKLWRRELEIDPSETFGVNSSCCSAGHWRACCISSHSGEM